MHLNQLRKPALEALEEEKWAYKESRKLQLVDERKRKISVLKNKLAAWGIDVTYWRYTQFKIGDHLFVLREDKRRYDLVARKKCASCKAVVNSFPIKRLLDLGRVLTDDNMWSYHECRPKEQPAAPRQLTNEEKVYNLVAELVELVTKEPTSRVV